jgi:hypothetical protein
MEIEKSHIATQLEIARINLRTADLKAANAAFEYMTIYNVFLKEKQACQRIVYALELAEDAE